VAKSMESFDFPVAVVPITNKAFCFVLPSFAESGLIICLLRCLGKKKIQIKN